MMKKNQSLLTGPMPKRLPRRAKLVGVAIAVLALVPGSMKDADAGQQQELPTFSALPVGKVTAVPDGKEKPPTSIPASESVSGFRVLNGSQFSGGVLQISSEHVSAGVPTTYDGVTGCYSQRMANALAPMPSSFPEGELGSLSFGLAMNNRAFEWEQGLGWQTTVFGSSKVFSVVHNERVVDPDSQKPTFESTDAWFDPSTKGFRLINKGTLPLRPVGSAPGGIQIFAGRDDRPNNQRLVHFIIARAKDTPYDQLARTTLSRGESTTSAGACGHHRLSLIVRKEGDSGVIELTAILPELKPGEQSNAAPLPPLPPSVTQPSKDIRTRRLRAQFSVSQTSRDKEPVLSIATSWAGPEVLQRVFTPAPVPPAPPPRTAPSAPPPKVKKLATKKPPPRVDPGF